VTIATSTATPAGIYSVVIAGTSAATNSSAGTTQSTTIALTVH
jgi:hypothetical protein